MKRNKKGLIKLSIDYLNEVEQLLPELEKEILWRIIDVDLCREYTIFFERGKLIIDLSKSSSYRVCTLDSPYCESDRLSMDVIYDIGMPKYSTETSKKCKDKENYFIRSILTELSSGVKTGLDLLSILRTIREFCSIDTYYVPKEDLRGDSRITINIIESYIDSSSNDYFRIYYEVSGDKDTRSIRLSNFNSIGLAKRFIL